MNQTLTPLLETARCLPQFQILGQTSWSWGIADFWTVMLGAITAMSCSLPGIWLILRRQSLMGDALSHTALPGVVMTFLAANWAVGYQLITPASMTALEPLFLTLGAVLIGILTAVLTETLQSLGRVESSAALGVVFTSLFALGLLLIRLKADSVHIDPDCVLFGQLELAAWDTIRVAGLDIPRAFLSNAGLFLINGLLMLIFFKELRLTAFDPELATSLGIHARAMHYCLMSATAVTLVMAFTSVGSILVIALLIVPAACGLLASSKLPQAIFATLVVAALSALLGHVMAKTVPGILGRTVGLQAIEDVSTAGMMAVASGIIFIVVWLTSPRHSVIVRWFEQVEMLLRMTADDVLGKLYRNEERNHLSGLSTQAIRADAIHLGFWIWYLTVWRLRQNGWVTWGETVQLTEKGRTAAASIVRGHRLWESYLFKNFNLTDPELHGSADRVEHYLNPDLQSQLAAELDSPQTDPHGKVIPPDSSQNSPESSV